MASNRSLTTKEKALAINLNPEIYGSFAEIGAGQEVAAHFFKAGGASGTIAKTMSAYDMKFSDAIYGKSKRYVSRERLMTMLNKEYRLLGERLTARKDKTLFFALANTIETLNFRRTNQGQGWMGVRFQLHPSKPANNCVLHVVLKDDDAIWQQQVIGILGVNMLYACFYAENADHFLDILMEELSPHRLEIDMLSFSGPDYYTFDNRILSLKLVLKGMTPVAIFAPNGKNVQPSEILYKKNILALRGRFRPVTHVNVNMLETGQMQFLQEPGVSSDNVIVLFELTLQNLHTEGRIDEKDFLDRVDILCSLGQNVMISNYHQYYKLVSYLSQFTRSRKIGIILGINNLQAIFEEKHYQHLQGGILEAFGILFGVNVKLYVYPAHNEGSDELYTCFNFELPDELFSLYRYLFDNNKLEDIRHAKSELLHITSDHVLAMIQHHESGWEEMVPKKVEETIKRSGLLGYQDEDLVPKQLKS